MRKLNGGFTLIEVMIVVVIIGILAAIAYPSYTSYVEKARRADGKAALLAAAQRLERCYTQNNSYAGCAVAAASPDGFYIIAAPIQTATTFTLTATPQGAQANSPCGIYTLQSDGIRDDEGSASDRCW
ncbi:MAG: type IV pilin protein [Gammaproteobacteria bacterium]